MLNTSSYLQKNEYGIYYFRMAVPKALWSQLGRRELRKSLRTNEQARALSLAKILSGQAELYFQRLKGMARDKDNFPGLITFDSLEIGDLKISGGKIECDTPEEERRHLDTIKSLASKTQDGTPKEVFESILLSELIEEFCEEKVREGSWTEKTEHENRALYSLLLNIVGDVQVDLIGYEQARDYKKSLLKLPPGINKNPLFRSKSIEQIIKMETDGMSVATINKNLNRASSLFGWARKQRLVSNNFFEGLGLKKKKQDHEERAVFVKEDLDKLFASQVYMKRNLHHPYYYWLPLISLHTGARIEEICQLYVEDIRAEQDVWVFDINQKGDKKTKTLSSQRLIPIHSFLISKGLLEYVKQLKAQNNERLFGELNKQRDGYSQSASKWFSRYKSKCGVTDRNKTFHSFRHTVANTLKQKGVDGKMISAILGHKDDSITTGRYGKSYEPKVLLPIIEQLDYQLPELLSFF